MKEENSSLFAHLDQEDEEIGLLGGEDEFNKLQLNRYIEVLQIKRKDMDMGKKVMDLATFVPGTAVQLMDAPSAERLMSWSVPRAKSH